MRASVPRDEHAVRRAQLYGPRLERAAVLVRAGTAPEDALRVAIEEFFRDRQDRASVAADLARLLAPYAGDAFTRCARDLEEAARESTETAAPGPRRCGPVTLHEDGAAFLCMGCGAMRWRTRSDLYGDPEHVGEPRWNEEYAALCENITAKRRTT